MDLFKLVGSIFIKNDDANKQIDETAKKGKQLGETIGQALQTAGDKISNVGVMLAPVSATVGAVLTASVKSGSDFTDGMAKMSTLFDTTKTSVDELGNKFIDLSNKTGISATELAEAGYQALSAGQDVKKVTKFVETAGNLAKAGFTSASTSVDVLTTAMNAYGKGAGTAEEIANKLVRTQNLGKTTVDELGSSMGKIIPTASAMGVNIDNLTSGYVSLTKQGVATAEATTYMNSMLNELGDSGTDLGGIIKDQTGKSFQELMKEGKSLADVLQITKDYADENGIAYNELWGSAEAGKAGLAILNGGVKEFNDTVGIMQSKTDDIGDALEKLETPSMKTQKALNRVKNSGVQLGQTILNSLAPAIDKVGSVVEKSTDWFSGLSEETKQTIAVTGGVVTALSPVLIVGGKIISGVGKLIPVLSKGKTALTATKVVIGGLSAPLGVVLALIGVLAGAFFTLWKTNTTFRNKMISIWNTLKGEFQVFVEQVQKRIGGLKTAFNNIATVVKRVWFALCDALGPVFIGAFQNISTFLGTILNVIIGILDVFIGLFTGDWDKMWSGIERIVTSIWNGIKKFVKTSIDAIIKTAKKILSWFDKDWSKIWGKIKTNFQNFWKVSKDYLTKSLNTMKTKVKTSWESIKTTLSGLLGKILSIVKDKWSSIKTTISGKLDSIKTAVKDKWESIKSDVSTKVESIKTTIRDKWESIRSSVSGKVESIKSSVSGAWDSIKSSASSKIDSIKSTVSEKFESIRSKISGKINSAKTAVSDAIDAIKEKFNFSWSLPSLKLPHVSITGSFSLTPPSTPKFSVSWYKKAMEQPYLFTKPTVFSLNPLRGAGEAGDEVMYGHENLMNDIRTAVRSDSNTVVDAVNAGFDKLFRILGQYFPEFSNIQMVLDTGVLVGATATQMDKALGVIKTRRDRK